MGFGIIILLEFYLK